MIRLLSHTYIWGTEINVSLVNGYPLADLEHFLQIALIFSIVSSSIFLQSIEKKILVNGTDMTAFWLVAILRNRR